MIIRKIKEADNYQIAEIIKQVLISFNADPKTTFLGDPARLTMFYNYQKEGADYFVTEMDTVLIGGCGINQLDGGEKGICELQRMFLLPEYRGKGIGSSLMKNCLSAAKQMGYSKIYLESLSQMKAAIQLYEHSGFVHIPKALGNTGHGGCNVFMVMDLIQ